MGKRVANVQLMQKMNRLDVLNFIRRNSNVTRPQLAEETGLSLASITNITAYLLENGFICEGGTEEAGRVGRKSTLLNFCAKSYDLVCVYLSDKDISIALTDLKGRIKKKISEDAAGKDTESAAAVLKEGISSLLRECDPKRILGIEVAISGLVLENSRFVLSSSLKWKALNIKQLLEESFSLPVFVDNVSLLKAVRYFRQSDREDISNMLFIDMEKGIGAVQYINGEVPRRILGEVGHTTVEKDGDPCFCGNSGCLEVMCSPARAISLYASSSGKSANGLKEIENLYKAGDKSAVYAVNNCGKYLGIGLANLVNLFNPSSIVINVGDFRDCPSVFLCADDELRKRAYPSLTENIKIEKVELAEEDIIFGSADSLCDRLFSISSANCPVE